MESLSDPTAYMRQMIRYKMMPANSESAPLYASMRGHKMLKKEAVIKNLWEVKKYLKKRKIENESSSEVQMLNEWYTAFGLKMKDN